MPVGCLIMNVSVVSLPNSTVISRKILKTSSNIDCKRKKKSNITFREGKKYDFMPLAVSVVHPLELTCEFGLISRSHFLMERRRMAELQLMM